jgi:hypothetical protein
VELDRRGEVDDAAHDLEDRRVGDQFARGFGASDETPETASPDSPRVADAEGDAGEPGCALALESVQMT